jgi:hypothetical protein
VNDTRERVKFMLVKLIHLASGETIISQFEGCSLVELHDLFDVT